MGRRRLNRFKIEPPSEEELKKYYSMYRGDLIVNSPEHLTDIDSQNYFGNDRPLYLDLGCGRGEFTVQQASENPQRNFIGIDHHRKSLYDAVSKAAEEGIDNVHFIKGDLRWILKKCPDTSAEEAYLLFPSPHTRRKHVSKDYLMTPFFEHLHRILTPGARIHLVTDHEEFFHNKTRAIAEMDLFTLVEKTESFEGGITWYQKIWENHGLKTHRAEYVKD